MILLVGGLSIITGFLPIIGIICVVVFLVPVAFMMHNFWTVEDQQMQQVEMSMFLKNIGLAASALIFLAIPQPWAFSLGF